MDEIYIDLYNCIEFKEIWNDIVCGGSYDLWGTDISYSYNYPKYKDNKLRRIYAVNKVHKRLCEIANLIFNPNLYENEWQH